MAFTPNTEGLSEALPENPKGARENREKPGTLREIKDAVSGEMELQIDAKLAELGSRIEEEKRLKQQRPPEQRMG
jgi:hypothetical protein